MALQTQPTAGIGVNPWGAVANSPFQASPAQQMSPNGFAPQPTGFPSNGPFPAKHGRSSAAAAATSGSAAPNELYRYPWFWRLCSAAQASKRAHSRRYLRILWHPSRREPRLSKAGCSRDNKPRTPSGSPCLCRSQLARHYNVHLPPSRPIPSLAPSPQESQTFNAPALNNTSPFQSSAPQLPQPQPQQQPAPLMPMPTGTNPFSKTFAPSQPQTQQRPVTASALISQPTGSTNPFRQGAFVNHGTGMGWQHNQQPIGGASTSSRRYRSSRDRRNRLPGNNVIRLPIPDRVPSRSAFRPKSYYGSKLFVPVRHVHILAASSFLMTVVGSLASSQRGVYEATLLEAFC